ncbi:uncharacterized protein LOC121428994 [Lytechinus variegatus]|uniref:uncharacterized protein LOC121428994 n=1 Tax=Lytechinus variegatus TaxID=7654 RepID=UPI001BB26511|nr:uncharacterized protein LOC121428994 [Lytechinus variegatus]
MKLTDLIMAAASATATVVKKFIHVLVICFLLREVRGNLPTLTVSDIRTKVVEKCVIAVFPSDDENLLQTAEEIGQLFQPAQVRSRMPGVSGPGEGRKPLATTEAPVTVGIVEEPIDVNDDRLKIKNSASESKDNSVIIFPPIKKDRTCLLPPPKSFLTGEVYRGPISKALLLDFINIRCLTYVDVNGGLNIEGLHRQGILDTMFYMRYLPESVKMAKLSSSCGKCDKPGGGCSESSKESTTEEESCHKENVPSEPTVDDFEENLQIDGSETFAHKATKYSQVLNTPMAECERISDPAKEDFINYYLKRSRPVVIPNGASHWPAFTKWTMEYLREMYGNKSVHIKLAPDGVFEGVEPATLWEDYGQFSVPEQVSSQLLYPDLVVVRPATQNVKFSEFLDLIQNSSNAKKSERDKDQPRVSIYLEYSSIPSHFPKLEEDVEDPPYIQDVLDRRHLNIWLSDGDTLGKLHFDPFDNFLCQLRGRKELTLFEPHNNTQLYEAHIPEALLGFDPATQRFRRKKLMDSTSMVMSPVDIKDPDYKRFPEFAEARPLNCTLTEGDILFMPAFWWHEVQSYPNEIEGRNLAVNFWYEPFFSKEFPCPECKLDVNPYYRHLLRVENEHYREDDYFED